MISHILALFDLEESLSRKRGSLTPQEKQLLEDCHKTADRSFFLGGLLGGLLGGAIATAATGRGMRMLRTGITVGVGFPVGFYAGDRSLRPYLEKFLALEGSQLQRELAIVILQKHSKNASLMRLFSRHFYVEDVMDDSTSGSKTVRQWRYRNFYFDNVHGGTSHALGSQAEYGDSPHDHGSQADAHVTSISDTNGKKASVKSKQLPIINNLDAMDNPLEQVFGDTTPAEEIQLPSGTRTPTKELSRSLKRSHRRRRHRQREASADWELVQPQRI